MSFFAPLRHRNFALLWAGMTVSLLGDGMYLVALPYLAYGISDDPSSFALVGLCWSLAMVCFLLVGGVLVDRVGRRGMMLAGDGIRLVSVSLAGALAVTDQLEIWHMAILAAVFGAGEGLFVPAFSAVVPDVVPEDDIVAANGIQQFVRPLAMQLAGPAIGGVLVAATGAGGTLLVNAGTFLVSFVCILLMRVPPVVADRESETSLQALRAGLAFVLATRWLRVSLAIIATTLLVAAGPVEVLIPYEIRHRLGGDPADFGWFLAATGAGSIVGAVFMGRRSLPARPIPVLYAALLIDTLAIAAYGAATGVWQLFAFAFVAGIGLSVAQVVWGSLLQSEVPRNLRGRVSSLDWLVSLTLYPISFAAVGPLSDVVAPRVLLIAAGLLGSGVIAVTILVNRQLWNPMGSGSSEAATATA